MDPQQELFSALLVGIRRLGYDAYDGMLPPDGTPYPFVYLADSQLLDDANKSAVFGTVEQTVHVWHNDVRKRGDLSAVLLAIKTLARELERTEHFAWFATDVNQRILSDTSTKQPLMHGVLEITFKFS